MLKKVRVVGMDQTTVTLEGTLEILNPNDRDRRFSGYRFQLDVEGQRLLTGESNRPFDIPALESASITVPAVIRFQDLLTLNRKGLLTRDLNYLLFGTVFLDSWMGNLSLPFAYEDTLNLPDLLREKTRLFLQGL
ncbi:MAG: hypothetical protein A2Y79_02700 [Deltaproteobacteria bacterium RBG_13_43_22]|nr:MAG: hypothetical protein A2Y79_02700 [Deltaproteobacteria bacterium RBG_13_43_22]